MNNLRLVNYMHATLCKDFDAVFQLLTGDFAVPLCHPPTLALNSSLQLCRAACNQFPRLLESCDNKRCHDHPSAGLVLTLLRAACMDARLPDGSDTVSAQGSVLALLLLAGADDLEGASDACGLCYETPCDPVTFGGMDMFPKTVLGACTVNAAAAERAAAWPRVKRRLAHAEEGEARMELAKTMFVELCCKDLSPSFFKEWEARDPEYD